MSFLISFFYFLVLGFALEEYRNVYAMWDLMQFGLEDWKVQFFIFTFIFIFFLVLEIGCI